jgi:hypothetical protein
MISRVVKYLIFDLAPQAIGRLSMSQVQGSLTSTQQQALDIYQQTADSSNTTAGDAFNAAYSAAENESAMSGECPVLWQVAGQIAASDLQTGFEGAARAAYAQVEVFAGHAGIGNNGTMAQQAQVCKQYLQQKASTETGGQQIADELEASDISAIVGSSSLQQSGNVDQISAAGLQQLMEQLAVSTPTFANTSSGS